MMTMTMRFRPMVYGVALALGAPTPGIAAPAKTAAREPVTKEVVAGEPAATKEASKTAVAIVVDVSKIDAFRDVFAKRLSLVASKRVAAGGMTEAASGRARIEIVVWPASAKRLGFDYSVNGWLDDRPLNVADNAGLCVPCMQEEVVPRIEAVLTRQVAALRDAANRPAEVPGTEPPPPVPTAGPKHPDRRGGRARLTKLGGAGVGIAGAGLAGIIAGAVLLARGRVDERGTDDPRSIRRVNYRPWGGAALGVGGGLFVAGIVVLAVDAARGRTARKSRRSAWAPAVDRSGVGAVWVWSF